MENVEREQIGGPPPTTGWVEIFFGGDEAQTHCCQNQSQKNEDQAHNMLINWLQNKD
jgi:hypothetical protein